MDKKIKNFNRRFNISYDEKKQFEEFKNRVLHSFDIVLGELFINNTQLEEDYIKLIGMLPKTTFSSVHRGGMNIANIQYALTGYTIKFNETRLWELLSGINNFVDLVKCIQFIFWLYINESLKDKFFDSIKQDIELSGVQLNIRKIKSGVVLYPKGARLLDEKIVNDVLNWLNEYPTVLKNFQESLEMFYLRRYTRDVVDKMRLSLELLLKSILNNRKNLDNQKSPLSEFLKKKNIPKHIINMYTTLLFSYSKYQDEYAKHDDKVDQRELEFVIYLTGCFMRFLITLGAKNE